MKWVRWLLIFVSVCCSIAAVASLFIFSPVSCGILGCILSGCCAVAAWPDTFFSRDSSHGTVYGISYYLEFDGVGHYFKADVYGCKVTASHERAIKEVIFKRLTQAVACRAVDKMIGRLK